MERIQYNRLGATDSPGAMRPCCPQSTPCDGFAIPSRGEGGFVVPVPTYPTPWGER
jgi:hypothetical protein